MRKQKSYLMAVAASLLMLPGCTSDDLSENFVPFLPGDSEVPISLSSGVTGGVSVIKDKPSTRAAIEDITDITDLYIYCLATSKQNGGEGIPDINWGLTSGLSCLMRNVKATCADGNVTWDGVYYYPLTQYYCYSFFAYTPTVPYDNNQAVIQNSTDVASVDVDFATAGGSVLLARYTLDGSQDLIWGCAEGDTNNKYSADYFRKEEGATTPTLELKHLLTRLTFTVTATEDLKNKEGQEIEIVGITIKDAIRDVGICVAHTGYTTSKQGQLYQRNASVADFKLKDSEGTEISATNAVQVQKLADKTPVGESIMLYPQTSYTLSVDLRAAGSEKIVTPSPVTLTLAGGGSFEAGKKYSVDLQINSLEDVRLKATLDEWSDGGAVTMEPGEIP